MAWVPTEQEIAAVLRLDGPKRYSYCVKKMADEQAVWTLRQEDGWALAGDVDGHELIPVWPHECFAICCALGSWAGFVPVSIELDVWMERWLIGMERDGRSAAVFPTPEERGVAVSPTRFADDLQQELAKYE